MVLDPSAVAAGTAPTMASGSSEFSGSKVYADSTESTVGDASNIACPSASADGWTMVDWPDTAYAGMTAPVCPYTIVLDTAPKEGSMAAMAVTEPPWAWSWPVRTRLNPCMSSCSSMFSAPGSSGSCN